LNFLAPLIKLASALAVYSFTANSAQALYQLPDPLAAGWKSKPVCEQLHNDDINRVLRCTFPPGVGHEPHYHVAHFGYALSGGKVRIIDSRGVREVELATGSSYSSSGVKKHEILNIGDTTVTYLIVEQKHADLCTMDWYRIVDKRIQSNDAMGHGPDLGSGEWRRAVEFKLNIASTTVRPPIDSDEWCSYIDRTFIQSTH